MWRVMKFRICDDSRNSSLFLAFLPTAEDLITIAWTISDGIFHYILLIEEEQKQKGYEKYKNFNLHLYMT